MSSSIWTWRNAILLTTLPATTKHVLMVISTHMNDMGEGCYPSTKRISQLASLSERAVCEHIGKAIELGWLTSNVHGYSGQGWARNEYKPAWPKGTDSDAKDEKGTDFHAEGTDFDDKKALTQGQSIFSKNIPVRTSHTPLPPKGKIDLPDWLDKTVWKDFLEHRHKLKAPMTAKAQTMMLNKLDRFVQAGQDPTKILEQSILSGWKDIFELKGNNNGNRYTGTGKTTVTDSINATLESIRNGTF